MLVGNETKAPDLNNMTALCERMYRLGFEDAKNKKAFGESLQGEDTTFVYQGQEMEQLTLF